MINSVQLLNFTSEGKKEEEGKTLGQIKSECGTQKSEVNSQSGVFLLLSYPGVVWFDPPLTCNRISELYQKEFAT